MFFLLILLDSNFVFSVDEVKNRPQIAFDNTQFYSMHKQIYVYIALFSVCCHSCTYPHILNSRPCAQQHFSIERQPSLFISENNLLRCLKLHYCVAFSVFDDRANLFVVLGLFFFEPANFIH